MVGITIAETDHGVVITVDTDVIERWRLDQALSLLDVDLQDFSHIEAMDRSATSLQV